MVRQYIGARYVPKFYENSLNPLSNEWEENVTYEALTVVTYLNDSYTSKKPVPVTVGNPRNNPEYWSLTGAYNAQVEEYREETQAVKSDLDNLSATCVKFFDALISAIATGLNAGDFIITKGFSNVNDGGAGKYYISDTTSDLAVEIGVNKYAILIHDGNVSINSLGITSVSDINNLISYCITNKIKLYAYGEYNLSSVITINGILNADFSNAKFTFTNSSGFLIDSATQCEIKLPYIVGDDSASTYGLKLKNCNYARFTIPYIKGFSDGLYMSGDAESCCYNQIFTDVIADCLRLVNFVATSHGWVNSNIFHGGKLLHSNAFVNAHTLSDLVKITSSTDDNSINGNNFIGLGLEDNTVKKIHADHFRQNFFYGCRLEGNGAIEFVSTSRYNAFFGGYGSYEQAITQDDTSYYNGFITTISKGFSIETDGTFPKMELMWAGVPRLIFESNKITFKDAQGNTTSTYWYNGQIDT